MMVPSHPALRSYYWIVGIEGTTKERHYSARELCTSDLADRHLDLGVQEVNRDSCSFRSNLFRIASVTGGPLLVSGGAWSFSVRRSTASYIEFMHVSIVHDILIDHEVVLDIVIVEVLLES